MSRITLASVVFIGELLLSWGLGVQNADAATAPAVAPTHDRMVCGKLSC